jgi:hypothetical protein
VPCGPLQGRLQAAPRSGSIAAGCLLGGFLPAGLLSTHRSEVACACGTVPSEAPGAVFENSDLGVTREPRGRRSGLRRDVKFGKRSARNWKNLYRGFLIWKQYVGNLASDYLEMSTLPVKKVICALGPRVYQPLLPPPGRSRLQFIVRISTLCRSAGRSACVAIDAAVLLLRPLSETPEALNASFRAGLAVSVEQIGSTVPHHTSRLRSAVSKSRKKPSPLVERGGPLGKLAAVGHKSHPARQHSCRSISLSRCLVSTCNFR